MSKFIARLRRAGIRPSVLVLVAMLVVMTAVSFAQTPPVSIEIDTDQLFTSTNTWISTFMPVFGLTGGIAIALTLLAFVVSKVVAAFKSAGGGSR